MSPNGKRGYFHHELFTAKTTQRNEKNSVGTIPTKTRGEDCATVSF